MSDFKERHFGGEIVLRAVRWYCRYPISYRDLETMMAERGVSVDHSTIVTAHPPASGFEVFVTVGERSGMWLSGMVCGWGSLMVTGG